MINRLIVYAVLAVVAFVIIGCYHHALKTAKEDLKEVKEKLTVRDDQLKKSQASAAGLRSEIAKQNVAVEALRKSALDRDIEVQKVVTAASRAAQAKRIADSKIGSTPEDMNRWVALTFP
jgi:Tfp pilus assembly protein PilO